MPLNVNLYWVVFALIAVLAMMSIVGHFAFRRHKAMLWLAAGLVAGGVSTLVFTEGGDGKLDLLSLALCDTFALYAVTQAIRSAIGQPLLGKRRTWAGVALTLLSAILIALGINPFVACVPFQLAGLLFIVDAAAALAGARPRWPERAMLAGMCLHIVFHMIRMPFFPSLLEAGHAYPSIASSWLNAAMLWSSSVFVPLVVIGLIARDLSGHIDELSETAQRDGLTGLYTRLAFEHVASHQPFRFGALITADIDHFKAINDSYGHPAGDDAIRLFASLCTDVSSVSGRIGGEEFAVLLPGASIVEAELAADTIRQRFRSTALPALGDANLSASFGVAAYGGSETFRETLIKADRALYRAKRQGRDCVVLHGSFAGEVANPILRMA